MYARGVDPEGVEDPDLRKMCRRIRVCFDPLKCHILSSKTVVV